jgi:hypothetical protein
MRETRRRTKAEAVTQTGPAVSPCYCAGVGPNLSALVGHAFDGPVFKHFRNAGVEVLMGMRALIDAQIEMLKREEQKPGRKVPVE